MCERLHTTSCVHELAVQDAMHSAPIAKRVLSAIACNAASTCRSAAANNIVHASACHACKDIATQHSWLEPRLFFVGVHGRVTRYAQDLLAVTQSSSAIFFRDAQDLLAVTSYERYGDSARDCVRKAWCSA